MAASLFVAVGQRPDGGSYNLNGWVCERAKHRHWLKYGINKEDANILGVNNIIQY